MQSHTRLAQQLMQDDRSGRQSAVEANQIVAPSETVGRVDPDDVHIAKAWAWLVPREPLEAEEENPEAADVQNHDAFQRVQGARAPHS